jgi:hypothetical protein
LACLFCVVAQVRQGERGGLTKAEAQVTDDPGTVTRRHGDVLRAGLVTETELRLHSSADLAGIASLVLDVTVPDFADAGTVFVLEHPPGAGELPAVRAELAARRLGTRLAHASQHMLAEAFPAGEMIAFAAGSPYARCVRGKGQ